jgi:glycosyltransferase involved in cell wall biosynthesis
MPVRLLVFDEELFEGGVQTLCFSLLPALARLCETLVWAVPAHLQEKFRRRTKDTLILESHNWPGWSWYGLRQRVLRKASPWLPDELRVVETRSLRDARIRSLAKKYRCTHWLTSCIFSQALPDVTQPVFGFVCDVNPAMPDDVKANIARWLTDARGIFAISEFTSDQLRRIQPSQVAKVHPIPLSVPVWRSWTPKPLPVRQFDFYYPAAATAHKNHLQLFQACLRLAHAGMDFRLVLSGPGTNGFKEDGIFASRQMEEARRFLVEHGPLLNRVIKVIGEVDSAAVEALYEDTRCVVLPSLYEGFGFPLAEAIGRGLPVICSDIPTYREQIAAHGAFSRVKIVPAGDALELANTMENFLKCSFDDRSRQDVAERVLPWTWQDIAQRCFEVLNRETMKASL